VPKVVRDAVPVARARMSSPPCVVSLSESPGVRQPSVNVRLCIRSRSSAAGLFRTNHAGRHARMVISLPGAESALRVSVHD